MTEKIIAKGITVIVQEYFSKYRPFEVIHGRIVNKPEFPNMITIKEKEPGSSAWDKSTITKRYGSKTSAGEFTDQIDNTIKPLFVNGSDFNIGLYTGDVYSLEGKPYYIFKITDYPLKTITIPPPEERTASMSIRISSIGFTSKVHIIRTELQEDIQRLKQRIESLSKMPNSKTIVTDEEIETYVRSYYGHLKIEAVYGGKSKKSKKRH